MEGKELEDFKKRMDITHKHAYYYWAIYDLGYRFGFFKPVTVNNLKLTSGMIQQAYKEMKKIKFEGTIIDYLCWISLLHFLTLLKCIPVNTIDEDSLKKIDNWVGVLGTVYFSEINNMLRLFLKRPEYLTEAIDELKVFFEHRLRTPLKKILSDKFNYYIDSMTKLDLTKS